MKKIVLFITLLAGVCTQALAQDDLFGQQSKTESKKGVVFGVNGGFDIPAADMADRFGLSYRVGGAVSYKTKSNWLIGTKIDFILGSNIKEDSFLINLRNEYGEIIDQDGQRIRPGIFERGYAIGVQAGKIFNISKTNTNTGILVQTGVGFVQHKINIYERDNAIPQVRGDYKKGYDRLTNGLYIEQYAGYNHFSDNGLVNFHIGLNLMAGFTQGRREYLFDVMRKDDKSRVDILFGIRAGWYIPIFKRKSEDYYFE